MPSLNTIILCSLLAAANAFAVDILDERDSNDCPGTSFDNSGSKGCCVGGTVDSPFLSVCEGWPICEGPTTTTWSATPISCATIITSGANYESELSSARASLSASGTHYITTLDSQATATSSGNANPGQSASGGSDTAATGSASSSVTTGTTSSSSSDEGAAAGLAIQVGLTGGAFIAAAAAAML
ncbi:hypothetical protein F4804DRAFT_286845 [Jackrogersella minutella]|nr:hypothetical protein F4804DRAFT_286845 [Jackrogersella minutella]